MNKPFIFLLICICTLGACRTGRAPQVQTVDSSGTKVRIEYQEKVRDTTIQLPADSSWLKALLECDSMGRVKMKEVQAVKQGKNTRAPFISVFDNVLTTSCYTDSQSVYMHWKEVHERTDSSSFRERTVTIVKPVNYLTWWQKLFINSGKIAWVILVLFGGFKLYKSRI